ncbi:hypothetical protein K2X96_02655 [Patescibacteria group bacterium]|nr:hypothetical protein [Patescibacteria group bacterium]
MPKEAPKTGRPLSEAEREQQLAARGRVEDGKVEIKKSGEVSGKGLDSLASALETKKAITGSAIETPAPQSDEENLRALGQKEATSVESAQEILGEIDAEIENLNSLLKGVSDPSLRSRKSAAVARRNVLAKFLEKGGWEELSISQRNTFNTTVKQFSETALGIKQALTKSGEEIINKPATMPEKTPHVPKAEKPQQKEEDHFIINNLLIEAARVQDESAREEIIADIDGLRQTLGAMADGAESSVFKEGVREIVEKTRKALEAQAPAPESMKVAADVSEGGVVREKIKSLRQTLRALDNDFANTIQYASGFQENPVISDSLLKMREVGSTIQKLINSMGEMKDVDDMSVTEINRQSALFHEELNKVYDEVERLSAEPVGTAEVVAEVAPTEIPPNPATEPVLRATPDDMLFDTKARAEKLFGSNLNAEAQALEDFVAENKRRRETSQDVQTRIEPTLVPDREKQNTTQAPTEVKVVGSQEKTEESEAFQSIILTPLQLKMLGMTNQQVNEHLRLGKEEVKKSNPDFVANAEGIVFTPSNSTEVALRPEGALVTTPPERLPAVQQEMLKSLKAVSDTLRADQGARIVISPEKQKLVSKMWEKYQAMPWWKKGLVGGALFGAGMTGAAIGGTFGGAIALTSYAGGRALSFMGAMTMLKSMSSEEVKTSKKGKAARILLATGLTFGVPAALQQLSESPFGAWVRDSISSWWNGAPEAVVTPTPERLPPDGLAETTVLGEPTPERLPPDGLAETTVLGEPTPEPTPGTPLENTTVVRGDTVWGILERQLGGRIPNFAENKNLILDTYVKHLRGLSVDTLRGMGFEGMPPNIDKIWPGNVLKLSEINQEQMGRLVEAALARARR